VSVERNQPPLVVASRTRWPEAMKVRGPPAAYGQTDWRTLSSVPAPFGNVHVIVWGGPRSALAGADASSPPGPSWNRTAHTPAWSARLDRSLPLPGSPSPFMVIGPPGRPPPEMVASEGALPWAVVGPAATRTEITTLAGNRH